MITTLSLQHKLENAIEVAVERGWMTEQDLKNHKVGWFFRKLFIFGVKRSEDWEYFYLGPSNQKYNFKFQAPKKMRKELTLCWKPKGA